MFNVQFDGVFEVASDYKRYFNVIESNGAVCLSLSAIDGNNGVTVRMDPDTADRVAVMLHDSAKKLKKETRQFEES